MNTKGDAKLGGTDTAHAEQGPPRGAQRPAPPKMSAAGSPPLADGGSGPNDSEPTPPPRFVPPKPAKLPAEQAPRLFCGWSFETLDPDHPDPAKREFVRCVHCGRFYIAANWPGNCTAIHCQSEECEPYLVETPEQLIVTPRRPIPYNSGPLNSLSDKPLGISTGTVYLENGQPRRIAFRNNSDEPIEIPSSFGPLWLGVAWEDIKASVGGDPRSLHDNSEFSICGVRGRWVTLLPGESRTAVVRAHAFRPIRTDKPVKITTDQGFQVPTHQDEFVVWSTVFLFAVMLIAHWVTSFWAAAAPAATSTGIAALTASLLVAGALMLAPKGLIKLLRNASLSVPGETLWSGLPPSSPLRRFGSRIVCATIVCLLLGLVMWSIAFAATRLVNSFDSPALKYFIVLLYCAGVLILLEVFLRTNYRASILKPLFGKFKSSVTSPPPTSSQPSAGEE